MHTEEHRWRSPSLGHPMTLKVYGHRGIPFPGSLPESLPVAACIALTARNSVSVQPDIPAVYYNSPLAYLAGLTEPWLLEEYRRGTIMISVGQGAWDEEALEDTRDLQAICRAKAIPSWIDIWGHDVNHDWPWWYKQINHFLGHLCR